MSAPAQYPAFALQLRVVVVLLLLACAPATAATISLCASDGGDSGNSVELYGPDGKLVRLTIADDGVPGADCVSTELPVPAAAIRWSTLSDIPAARAPDRIALQGYFDAAQAQVSEVIHAEAEVQSEPGFLPFNSDVQAFLRPRVFGTDERASFEGGVLTCAAGDRTAGVVLQAEYRWEQLPGMTLAIEASASGAGEFSIAIADPPREQRELPLDLGSINAAAAISTSEFALPDNDQRWTSLVIFCPSTDAALTLHSVSLLPAAHAVAEHSRATWFWSPAMWRDMPETIWRIARDEQVDKIYLTIPVDPRGAVENSAQLAAFIREANARGIRVWAVVGDRADVLPQNLAPLLARANAYRQFNVEHDDAAIAGLQLDIEPYLLPGITLAPDYWRERYVATIAAVHAEVGDQLPLDLVMPVWWGTHPAWGSRLLDALAMHELSVTVMNYRTNVDALRVGAMPFLAWGREHGNDVAMALERGRAGVNAGNGRDETRVTYTPAAEGELWMMELGGIALLVLLDDARAGLPGQAYAQSAERIVSTGTISFAGAPANLQAIADMLEAEWSAWDSFAGLAIHGLDQISADAE